MASEAATDIERFHRVPIEDEIKRRSIELKLQGAELVGPCPVCEHCSICGSAPCGTPGLWRMCREVDRKAVAQRRPEHDLPRGWEDMSLGALWERTTESLANFTEHHRGDPGRRPLARPRCIEGAAQSRTPPSMRCKGAGGNRPTYRQAF